MWNGNVARKVEPCARGQHGFTLLELIITLAILSVLVGMAVPVMRNDIKRRREVELQHNLREIRKALDAFFRDANQGKFTELESDHFKDGYPTKLEYLVEGMKVRGTVDKTLRYLRQVPRDPMTNSTEWGLRGTEDDPDSSSWNGENIYNVYSKSNETALNGTKYSEW
jgi:general secretion pathway protein G